MSRRVIQVSAMRNPKELTPDKTRVAWHASKRCWVVFGGYSNTLKSAWIRCPCDPHFHSELVRDIFGPVQEQKR